MRIIRRTTDPVGVTEKAHRAWQRHWERSLRAGGADGASANLFNDMPKPDHYPPVGPLAVDFNAYDGAPDNGSAWIEGPCIGRVRRGGSWGDPPELLRSAARLGMDPRPDPRSRRRTDRSSAVGFRVARDLMESM